MAESPLLVDAKSEFLSNALKATRRGLIAWEATADPQVVVGALEGEYSLKLAEVSAFGDIDGDETPDYVLSLNKGRQPVLQVDRRDFPEEQDFSYLIRGIDGQVTAHHVFKELWQRAHAKAYKITEELDRVNEILSTMIKDDEIPF